MQEVILSDRAPQPVGPYSQAIAISLTPSHKLYFLSGQIPLDPQTGKVTAQGIAAQTEQVLANIQAVLSASGLSFANVIKTTVFLKDMADFSAMNQIYAKYFSDLPPARSCVQVSRLPLDVLVEIECIAIAQVADNLTSDLS
jgi:2-iminobutanoate/2-iminopropanoate deaminase